MRSFALVEVEKSMTLIEVKKGKKFTSSISDNILNKLWQKFVFTSNFDFSKKALN